MPDEDQPLTIHDLRPFIAEIKKLWLMGDPVIIQDASRALTRVLHSSAKRLRKKSPRSS
jgi:hypothetical protein